MLVACRYGAQPLTEETLLEEQQRAEAMLQAASDGIAPTAQDLPQGQPGEKPHSMCPRSCCTVAIMHVFRVMMVQLLQSDIIFASPCS